MEEHGTEVVGLRGAPANPARALGARLKAALGLQRTPRLLPSTAGAPGTYTVRLAFKDAQRAVGLGSVTLFGVKVQIELLADALMSPLARACSRSPRTKPVPGQAKRDRLMASMIGMHMGDAISAPLHWYYSYQVLREHVQAYYGGEAMSKYHQVHGALRSNHPDSAKYFAGACEEPNIKAPKADIVHEKGEEWRTPGMNYHADLRLGESSLTSQVAQQLADSIVCKGGYDYHDYIKRYISLFCDPGRHHDTYIETVHRHYFEQLGEGVPAHECGLKDENCLSGFATVMPLMLMLSGADHTAQQDVIEKHLRLTHDADALVQEVFLVHELVSLLLGGACPHAALGKAFELFDKRGASAKECSLATLVGLSDEELFIGSNPYALAGQEGCARFSLR